MSLERRRRISVGDYPSDPTRLLKTFDLYRAPVDVYAGAEKLGIDTAETSLDDRHSAFLVVKKNKARIFVNANHHPNRQRFSVAHEIGHFLLHHVPSAKENNLFLDEKLDLYHRKSITADGAVDFALERQANRFAAEFLMPKGLIERYVDDEGLDILEEKAMKKVSLAFKVSEQSLLIRLLELGFVSATV
jgi:Zn-dependent peptidase ImmA (M78 family)